MSKVHPSPLMRRAGGAGVLLVAAAGIAPVAAQAATVQGAVVARDAHRGTIVTAGPGGRVATLRVDHAGQARVGRRVHVTAVQLADGSYRVSRLRVAGRAARVKVRATVVRRLAAGYLVSAGGSTFSLSLRRASHGRHAAAAAVATPALEPGDVILATADPTGGDLQVAKVQVTGQSPMAELQGILVSTTAGQLSIAVEHQGLVTVAVPAGMTVQGAPGDEVELMVSVGSDGTFTLVSAAGDDQSDRHDSGFQYDGESGQVEVHGLITALAADAVTVQAGQSAPITCAVPAGVAVTGFAVGDQVELHCNAVGGASLTLREMQSDHAQVQSGSAERHGDNVQDSEGDQPDGGDAGSGNDD